MMLLLVMEVTLQQGWVGLAFYFYAGSCLLAWVTCLYHGLSAGSHIDKKIQGVRKVWMKRQS
jgi:hypothetical protein